MRLWHCTAVVVLMVLVCLSSRDPAAAHGGTFEPVGDGIPIPNLTHGEMAVMARYRSAIAALGEGQVPEDRVTRRLLGYISIQSSACLWGMMPGSLTDEASPFNECTHAFLAGTKALLLHLAAAEPNDTAVRDLIDRVQLDMLEHSAALQLCRYSGEFFSTANIVWPRWGDVPIHGKSAATLLVLLLAGGGFAFWLWRPRQPLAAP